MKLAARPRQSLASFFLGGRLLSLAVFPFLVCLGCSKEDPTKPDNPSPPEPVVLNLYIWEEYVDPELLKEFEAETGIKITVGNYYTNEEMIEALEGGKLEADLICPSDYAVEILISKDLLAELDPGNLSNLVNIDQRFFDVYYDPNLRFCVPYQWGTTGFAYNGDHIPNPPATWAGFFDPAFYEPLQGKISLLDDSRETIGAALLSLGYSANTKNPQELAEAESRLQAFKPCVRAFDSDDFDLRIQDGSVWLAHGFSGDFLSAIKANPAIRYVVPTDNVIVAVDNLAILKRSPYREEAERFINFILRPGIARRNAEFTGFETCVVSAQDMEAMPPGPIQEQLHARPEGTFEMLQSLPGSAQETYDRIWENLRGE